MSYIEIFGTLFDASFGGTDLSDYNFYCYDIEKPFMSKQEDVSFNPPKRMGKIQVSKKLTDYQITLKGYIEATSHSDLITKINALAGFLYSDTDKALILSNENDRYWNVQYLDYIEIGKKDNYTLIDLVFDCPNDPVAYDNTPDTDSQTITVLNTTFNLTNSGHYYAYPVFTITFNQAQTHIHIENNTIEDNGFDISGPFVSGDVLVINCKTGVITLNGTTNYTGFGDGGDSMYEYILLAVGVNQIEVSSDDADINITLASSWEKTYLS